MLVKENELNVRYQPTPKRHGEIVRKDTIVDYVKRSKLAGRFKKDFEVYYII